ncbi:hypothetical protein L208DRAFT_1413809 [Tricholoma matsutake]|nr:hypothetical protein L208DRAFT_1415397 [Tricholoma matsutake 945]KAF8222220.1 hypothetical protein L208DRAFT_1413809 [Tricholoma matsutake 945]
MPYIRRRAPMRHLFSKPPPTTPLGHPPIPAVSRSSGAVIPWGTGALFPFSTNSCNRSHSLEFAGCNNAAELGVLSGDPILCSELVRTGEADAAAVEREFIDSTRVCVGIDEED